MRRLQSAEYGPSMLGLCEELLAESAKAGILRFRYSCLLLPAVSEKAAATTQAHPKNLAYIYLALLLRPSTRLCHPLPDLTLSFQDQANLWEIRASFWEIAYIEGRG